MELFKLILKLAGAIFGWMLRKGETKDAKIVQVKKDIKDAFKEKDKATKISKLNAAITNVDRL